MDNRSETREFLTSRRARITPEQAGLPVFGGPRRVLGLRRAEAAVLAGGRAEQPLGRPRRQPARLCPLLRNVLRSCPAGERGPVCLLQPAIPRLLRGLGPSRE